jgi:hypothetical protein
MSEYSPDLHVKIRRFARLHGRGCSRHCPCKWCKENRTFKNKRQAPVDDYGHILK